jgi:hypothetical protein
MSVSDWSSDVCSSDLNMEIHMKNGWFLMIRYVVANLGEIKLCLMPCST